jgi:GABA permease
MLEAAGSAVPADTLKRVVVMRRCLVVANQTLQAAELRDELRKRVSAGPCSFFVIVPDTKAAQHDPVAAGGVLPQPGMWWWATYCARPATDEETTAQARERLSVMLDGLGALGVPRRGRSGQFRPDGGH